MPPALVSFFSVPLAIRGLFWFHTHMTLCQFEVFHTDILIYVCITKTFAVLHGTRETMVNRCSHLTPTWEAGGTHLSLSESWKGAEIIFIPPFYGGTQRGKGKLSEDWVQEDLAGQLCGSRKN